MSLIVAARFDSFPEAEAAARRLFGQGIAEEDVSIFFVNPAGQHDRYPLGGDTRADPGARHAHFGALAGAGLVGMAGAAVGGLVWIYGDVSPLMLAIAIMVGAYIGSLAGALVATRSAARRAVAGHSTGVRRAGVLTAVHVTPDNEAQVARTLKACGGLDVEKAAGRWRDGNWVDFDPVAPPVLSDKVPPRPDPAAPNSPRTAGTAG
ncbi:membrane protein [Pigmentiphaga soli]|uniref:Membrane protein n=1 Tax=Pigmentiphaga soli TaxID=1007095 RepID=A0ABP8GPS8_9BURK